jgi:hypothetical protein
MNIRQHLTQMWLPAILIIMPVALVALYIFSFGVDVPFWDGWGLVSQLDQMESPDERLQLQDLWAQHNEDRIFFPRMGCWRQQAMHSHASWVMRQTTLKTSAATEMSVGSWSL